MAVLADVNGDGKLDVITADGYAPAADNPGAGGHGVSLLLGNGNGTFQAARTVIGTGNPIYVLVGDFDGDAKADLIVNDGFGENTISFFKGNGNGTFLPPVKSVISADPLSNGLDRHGNGMLISADFNGDGKLDLAITFNTTTLVSGGAVIDPTTEVLLNNGNGTFHPTFSTSFPGALGGDGVFDADFNGDGKKDLLIYGVQHLLEIGNGDGTFHSVASSYTSLPANVESNFRDFSKDGRVDALTITSTPPRTALAYFISLSLGSVGTTFTSNLPNFFPAIQSTAVAADFNGDGLLDVATTNMVAYNLNSGLFQPFNKAFDFGATDPALPAGDPYPTRWLATGDLDRNGSPDLISTEDGSFVEVALNTGGNPPLLASLTADRSTAVTGTTVTETVSVGSNAPVGGSLVALSSNSPSAVVPVSVTIPAGSQSATFSVATTTGAAPTQATISATYRGLTLKNKVTVVPHFALSSVTCPASVFGMFGGNPAVATITLSGPAADGAVVKLSSSNVTALSVPATVTVPAGATSVTFKAIGQFVSATTSTTVMASFQGVAKTATVTVKKETANITITKAEYSVSNKTLRVEGTTTSASLRLTLYDRSTGLQLGQVSIIGGKFTGQFFNSQATPITSMVAQSSLGEAATSAVAQK